MAKHQIIYTSCKKGIEGSNDGQQVFSYDEGFENYKNTDVVKLFGYKVPLKSGESMTEELALTMPQAFAYRFLKNGQVAILLNTYLGRDYMGSKGRFGNTLSHVLVMEEEELDCYPCTLYKGSSLRSEMTFEEVNCDARPALLSSPELLPGDMVEPDNISEFLEDDDRMEHLKQMVAAALKYSSEKKRIIICDTQDNIVQWFAAIHYAFPIEIARKIWFSSYVYDPEVADTPLCGVVSEGSKYDVSKYQNNKGFHLFDFMNGVVVSGEEQNDFLEFLDGAFSYSYSRLEEFKNFVAQKTTFREVNEEYYDAYHFFRFATESIDNIEYENFQKAVAFSERYATLECKMELISRLVNDSQTFACLGKNYKYVFELLTYMLKMYSELNDNTKNSLRKCVIERLFFTLSDQDMNEKQFLDLYEQIKKCAGSMGLSIPTELAKKDNQKVLFQLMGQGVETWKTKFTLRTITDYVIDQELPYSNLEKTQAVGCLQYGIVLTLVKDEDLLTLDELISELMELYRGYPKYLLYFTFIIEDALQKNGKVDFQKYNSLVWNCFAEKVKDESFDATKWVNEELNQKKRIDELFIIYQFRMKEPVNYGIKRNIFLETYQELFSQNSKYLMTYLNAVMDEMIQVYLEESVKISEEKLRTYGLQLIGILTEEKYFTEETRKVCDTMEPYYYFKEQDEEQEKVVCELMDYYEACKEPISGKLQLAVVERSFEGITKSKQIDEELETLKKVVTPGGADVQLVGELAEREKYYQALYLDLLECEMTEKRFHSIHQMYNLEGERAKEYYAYVAKLVLKKSKKDFNNLAGYLCSVLDINSKEVLEEVGSNLCSMGDKKLEELDLLVKKILKLEDEETRKKKIKNWKIIYEKAVDTNPLIKGITGLFGRNK